MTDTTENDAGPRVIETECVEWAIQCHTRDGDLFTGREFASRSKAEDSGERLARINGADWWLVSRRVKVTVLSDPWTRVTPPGDGQASS